MFVTTVVINPPISFSHFWADLPCKKQGHSGPHYLHDDQGDPVEEMICKVETEAPAAPQIQTKDINCQHTALVTCGKSSFIISQT